MQTKINFGHPKFWAKKWKLCFDLKWWPFWEKNESIDHFSTIFKGAGHLIYNSILLYIYLIGFRLFLVLLSSVKVFYGALEICLNWEKNLVLILKFTKYILLLFFGLWIRLFDFNIILNSGGPGITGCLVRCGICLVCT